MLGSYSPGKSGYQMVQSHHAENGNLSISSLVQGFLEVSAPSFTTSWSICDHSVTSNISMILFEVCIPSERYPAVASRYVLHLNNGCPWTNRANMVCSLKGLEDIAELVEIDNFDLGASKGWYFPGKHGLDRDPFNGIKYLRELYL